MCRHVAYVGWPRPLADVLLDAPHGLVTQVDGPRCQAPGVTNRDGWGVAWRTAGDDGWRQRRSTVPFSVDHDGQAGLRTLTVPAFVAAIRRASPSLALVESGNAPFVAGGWAFSLNGFVGGYAEHGRDALLGALSPARRAGLAGDTDSEVLFGITLDRMATGAPPGDALAAAVRAGLDAAGPAPSRLNLLLGDGTTIWASRWSNSLFVRPGVVASEPWDDGPEWAEVPDGTLVTATAAHVQTAPLG